MSTLQLVSKVYIDIEYPDNMSESDAIDKFYSDSKWEFCSVSLKNEEEITVDSLAWEKPVKCNNEPEYLYYKQSDGFVYALTQTESQCNPWVGLITSGELIPSNEDEYAEFKEDN